MHPEIYIFSSVILTNDKMKRTQKSKKLQRKTRTRHLVEDSKLECRSEQSLLHKLLIVYDGYWVYGSYIIYLHLPFGNAQILRRVDT